MAKKAFESAPLPLAVLFIPFVLGISIRRGLVGLSIADICAFLFLLFISFFLFLSSCLSSTDKSDDKSERVLADLCRNCLIHLVIFIVFCTAGYLHFDSSKEALESRQAKLLEFAQRGGKVILSGYVTKVARPLENGARVRIFVEHEILGDRSYPVYESLVVSFKNVPWDALKVGRQIRFTARLFKVRNFGTPGTFDYENWWALRGIMVRAVCQSPLAMVFVTKKSSDIGLLHVFQLEIEKVRFSVIQNLLTRMPNHVSPVAVALVTGSRSWLPQEQRDLFSSSGVGHLFAVSGLHMAMVAAIVLFSVRLIGRIFPWILLHTDIKKVSWMASVLGCGFYCALAGASPSSLRAFLMVASVAFCILLERKSYMESALFVAAWILLLKSPFYLFDISFQLSFFMVFFLMLWGRYAKCLMPFAINHVWSFLLLCLLAFIASTPIVAFYFHRLNPWSPLLNLLCIPIVEFVVLPFLFLGGFLSHVSSWLGTQVLSVASIGIETVDKLVFWFCDSECINHFILPPQPWELFLVTTIFLLFPSVFERRIIRPFVFILVAILVAGHTMQAYKRHHRGLIALHVVDVGQGLCQVLELPDGKTVVVDAGGFNRSRFDVGSRVVAPYLRRLGIKNIDVLAISHPDTDHIGGASSLVRQFQVGEVWLTKSEEEPKNHLYTDFIDLVKKYRVPIRIIQTNSHIPISKGVVIDCFVPEQRGGYYTKNDNSLVFKVTFNGEGVLMPGDIGKRRERELALHNYSIQSAVMVVPHHGSKGSSSYPFIKKVSPRFAVISCGYRNFFHLPSHVVLDRYKRLGVSVLRTDLLGTVDIKIAGNRNITASGYYMQNI